MKELNVEECAEARAHLVLRASASRPSETRQLSLSQPVKIGRSIARARPSPRNALFDCKVLSRNHALLWFDPDKSKFFLQDTKSSNGTFVNSQRLSKGSEESLPREVCSGDVVQFGVDVVENSRQQVTHGCVIATLKLFLPDGRELLPQNRLNASEVSDAVAVNGRIEVNVEELYQLHQCVQKALVREEMLQAKLFNLKKIIAQTQLASSEAWRSLIAEDLLLSRLETLERHLATYQQHVGEDKLRCEIRILMEEKDGYQQKAKKTLERLTKDNMSERIKVTQLQQEVQLLQEECHTYKTMHQKDLERHEELTQQVERLNKQSADLNLKLKELQLQKELVSQSMEATEKNHQVKSDVFEKQGESNSGSQGGPTNGDMEQPTLNDEKCLSIQDDSELHLEETKISIPLALQTKHPLEEPSKSESDETSFLSSETDSNSTMDLPFSLEEPLSLTSLSMSQTDLNESLTANDELNSEPSETKDIDYEADGSSSVHVDTSGVEDPSGELALVDAVASLQLRFEKCEQERDVGYEADGSSSVHLDTSGVEESRSELALVDVVASLQSRLHKCEEERDDLRQQLSTFSSEGCSESKLKRLVRVKERFHELESLNTQLETSLSEMEEEMETMRSNSNRATACAVVPLLAILVAVVMTFLDKLAPLLGTADN